MNIKPLRVLIVEDSADDAELIVRNLELNRYDLTWRRVQVLEDMQAALEGEEWDVVLSDYDLPRFSGPIALELTRAKNVDLPFIIVSGKIGEETAVQTMKAGANDYIMKDNLARLAPAIEREIEEAKGKKARRKAEDALNRTLDELEIRVEERTSILNDANKALTSEIGDRRRAENMLDKSHKQLRETTRRLELVREEERRSIAIEVHDELGQSLTGLKMDLAWLHNRLPHNELLQERVTSMSQTIDDTINKIRQISIQLRPAILDDLGLKAAIEWHLQEFQNQTGIRYEFKTKPATLEIDRDYATSLYRIIQETLTNIARHADASKAKVSLKQITDELVLTISDNGKGISQGKMQSSQSVGLAGMRERALSLGGDLSITAPQGKGTTIVVRIPRNSMEDAHDKSTDSR